MARHPFPRRALRCAVALVPLLALLLLPVPAAAAGPLVLTTQLIPAGASGGIDYFGAAVTISQDGSTALVGAWRDGPLGAAYVFARSGNTWTQQSKLTGSGLAGSNASFGFAVALSADGNAALIGAENDNSGIGAAFVFTRSGGVWTQQGSKLTVPDTSSCPPITGGGIDCTFGWAVALSGDGNTALVCAQSYGAAFVYTRTGTTWTQQQILRVGACQSAALSVDSNTAMVGAAIFIRTGTVWTQQQIVTATCNPTVFGHCEFGYSVALSADGNTALVGAPLDGNFTGSVFVFTRTGGVWTQQGGILTGPCCYAGISVTLSGDGNTALIGATDNGVYLFTRSGGVWSLQQTLTAPGGPALNGFGISVRLNGDATTAIVGDYNPTNQNLAGTAYIFANPRTLASIALSGTTALKVGQVARFAATGTFSDSTTGPLQWGTWQSSNPAVATVDASGNVTGQTAGTATITYTLDGVVGQLTVTVVAPTPIGVSVPSAPQNRLSGTTGGRGSPSPAPVPRSVPNAAPAGSPSGPTPNPAPSQR